MPVVVLGLMAQAAGLVLFFMRWEELPLVGLGPSLATFAFLSGVFLVAALLVTEARPLALVMAPIMAVLCPQCDLSRASLRLYWASKTNRSAS